jgi:hypothetical protein
LKWEEDSAKKFDYCQTSEEDRESRTTGNESHIRANHFKQECFWEAFPHSESPKWGQATEGRLLGADLLLSNLLL